MAVVACHLHVPLDGPNVSMRRHGAILHQAQLVVFLDLKLKVSFSQHIWYATGVTGVGHICSKYWVLFCDISDLKC